MRKQFEQIKEVKISEKEVVIFGHCVAKKL